MDWEQKFMALGALLGGATRMSVVMREPGNWYVSAPMECARGGMLCGEYGNGKTPQEAVENHWEIYSKEPVVRVDTITDTGRVERRVKWAGYMWIDVKEPKSA